MDADGSILNSVTKRVSPEFPQPGWSQQDPEDWKWAVFSGIPELPGALTPQPLPVSAAAAQMHGLVVLDDEDRVIRPAILWNDGRTCDEVEYLEQCRRERKKAVPVDRQHRLCGLHRPENPVASEVRAGELPENRKGHAAEGLWNYMLTGTHCCDYSDASGMLLLDVKNKRWSKEMLEICGISEEQCRRFMKATKKLAL